MDGPGTGRPDGWEIRDSLWQRRGVPGSSDSISGARESKVRTQGDVSDTDSDIAADRKYDDTSAGHGKMHDAYVTVKSKMNNVGSLRTRDLKPGISERSRRRETSKLVGWRDPELF
ncbi:hypothetical protein LSH36_633g02011 [Paralvinella palmiformis]|uniref:Uncharacterized protein n=1 Tax=Paralvinella palmiformis TaxID=53620 RepID=A0AAD9MWY6_9ANNE|nr:hypothetical protein LSH36_633g02011 [Paralvinella palmiformis]